MNKTAKYLLGGLIALLAFLANPHGPLGGFWRPSPLAPEPTAALLPFLVFHTVMESVAFAGAVVLLVTAYPKKSLAPLSLDQTRLAFLSLVWLLGSWWAHGALHLHVGMVLPALLYLEYAFHATAMAAAAYLFFAAGKVFTHRG